MVINLESVVGSPTLGPPKSVSAGLFEPDPSLPHSILTTGSILSFMYSGASFSIAKTLYFASSNTKESESADFFNIKNEKYEI